MSTLKTCYVRLNRNFIDSIGTIKINNFPMAERNESGIFKGGKNSSVMTSYSEASDGNNHNLRKNEKVEYFDANKTTSDGTSGSEWSELSEDDSSSAHGKTTQEKVGKRKERKTEDRKKLTCLDCDKSFISYSSYLIHKRSHESNQFKCILCKTSHKERQSFINHMKKYHPEVEPFLCDYRDCKQSFKTRHLLKLHTKMHLRYMCRFCKKLYVRKKDMRKHVLKIHKLITTTS